MAWATLRKTPVFGTIGGFLALHMLTVNTISTATAGFIFLLSASLTCFGIRWSEPMWINEPQKQGNIVPRLLRAGVPLVILSALLFAPIPGVKGSVAFAFIIYLALDLGLFLSQYSLWLAECLADPRPGIDR